MNRTATIALGSLAALSSCRVPEAAVPPPARRLSGVVRLANGSPAADGVVIVTDPKTTNEIATTRVSSQGRFALEAPVPQVALTVTTANGSAFLPKVEVGPVELEVRLDHACTPLRGEIEVDGPLPPRLDLLRIGRLGKDVGDTYGAPIDAERRFEACLPPAEYFVSLPPEFVERTILTMVPAPEPLHVHTVTRKYAETPPSKPLNLAPESQAGFVAGLPSSVRVLGLAESNHGSQEFTQERALLSIELARQWKFTVVMVEAGYGEVLPLDAYVHGAAVDVDVAIGRLGYWIWNTQKFRKALEALRDHNRTAAPDRQVSIVGIDMQSTSGALDDLLAAAAGLSPQDSSLLSRLRDRKGAAWRDFTQDERRSTRQVLEKLAGALGPGGLASEANRQALSARSLLLRLNYLESPGFWNETRARDRGMAQMVEGVLATEPGLRATLWAHLGHLAREYVVGAPTLGEHLAASLGDHYRVYAFLAYAGTARARDLRRELGVVAHSLAAAPAYTLEGALALSSPGPLGEVTYWSFGSAAARRAPWLRGLHWVRSFGATYPGDPKSFEIYDLRSLDGAVLFKAVTPSEPLAAAAAPSQPSP
jgi:erythromycin esterase